MGRRDGPGYETQDVPGRGMLWFFVWFYVGLTVFVAIAVGTMRALNTLRPEAVTPLPALPSPALQVDPDLDLMRLRADAERSLHGYAWVDRARGRARIPIERAMQLVLARIPSRPTVAESNRVAPLPEEGPPGPSTPRPVRSPRVLFAPVVVAPQPLRPGSALPATPPASVPVQPAATAAPGGAPP